MNQKIKYFFSVFVLSLFGFVLPLSHIFASTIFTDDFNNYSNGDVVGQGGWNVYPGYSQTVTYTVQSSETNEGAKAIAAIGSSGDGSLIYKIGDEVADGLMTFYFKASDNNARGFIILNQGLSAKLFLNINQGASGKVFFYEDNVGWTELGDASAGTWHSLQIQWRSSDHLVRYRLDNNLFTAYLHGFSPWTSGGLDGVVLGSNNTSGATFYFDTFQENHFSSKTPVLIVPGLMGTEMFNGTEKLWADSGKMLDDIGDNFMDPLQFNNNLTPSNSSVFDSNVIRKEELLGYTFDYTDGLINELKNQGYIEGEDLFTFPYDWRYGVSGKYSDNTTNVDLLAQKIQDIVTQTGSDKVDIIAHSQGGLIVKRYVVDHPADHHIGKAVFVGVPNTGAPKAIKALLQGDNFGVLGLSDAEIKKISENMPAAYDLLPSQRYYDVKGSFVKVVDDSLFNYSPKDLNYSEFQDFLTDDHSLNAVALNGAVDLHAQDFDNFDLRSAGVNLYAIDGCKAATISNIVEERYQHLLGNTEIKFKNPGYTPGDGTVPLESATNLPIDQSNKFYSLAANHGRMPSQDGIRQEIVNILAGSNLNIDNSLITQDINQCKLNGKAISVFSPVDIYVTDQAGNHLGLAGDGSIVNEIPNADFEVFGEHKFLYLPTDNSQTYTIAMQGTGTGTYTIASRNIVNDEVTGTEVFSNLPVTSDLTGQINLGATTTLTVVKHPGNSPETITSSSTVNAEKSKDVLPPLSTTTVSGTEGQQGFYRSNVTVNITATDQVITGEESQTSGVLSMYYNLDNAGEQKVNDDTTDITVSTEGVHTITFFATDNAGNNEPEKTITFTIDKTAPETIIAFDPSSKNLKFIGTDNLSVTPLVIDRGNKVTITDQAGNTIEINLDKDRFVTMSAEIKSIYYNGVLSYNINKNRMAFAWLYDLHGNLKALSQYAKSDDYNISAIYNGIKTTILGEDSSGKIFKTIYGLKLIKITTQNGALKWSY